MWDRGPRGVGVGRAVRCERRVGGGAVVAGAAAAGGDVGGGEGVGFCEVDGHGLVLVLLVVVVATVVVRRQGSLMEESCWFISSIAFACSEATKKSK